MAGRIAAAGTGQVEHEDGEVKAVRHYGGESLRHRRYVTPDEGVIVERIGDRDQRSELIAQKERRGERLERGDKYWKYNPGDLDERAHWVEYMEAYQVALERCSTAGAPWHVVPADHKWFARVVIGSAIVAALDSLDLHFPRADPDSLKEFKAVRKALEAEGKGKRAE